MVLDALKIVSKSDMIGLCSPVPMVMVLWTSFQSVKYGSRAQQEAI